MEIRIYTFSLHSTVIIISATGSNETDEFLSLRDKALYGIIGVVLL